ncbi:IS3 family transposase [Listeria seeligeri]
MWSRITSIFWNNQRILTKLGYLSPIDYRKKMAH